MTSLSCAFSVAFVQRINLSQFGEDSFRSFSNRIERKCLHFAVCSRWRVAIAPPPPRVLFPRALFCFECPFHPSPVDRKRCWRTKEPLEACFPLDASRVTWGTSQRPGTPARPKRTRCETSEETQLLVQICEFSFVCFAVTTR